MQPEWSAPLPDFSKPALRRRVRVGRHIFTLQLTAVLHEVEGESDTDLVHLAVLYKARPLTPSDLGVRGGLCASLWSYLCNKLTETTVDFYDPRPRAGNEINPRLGCWGTRPDLLASHSQDDCGLAVVVGISIWTVGARPMGGDAEYIEALAEALTRTLAYWVTLADTPDDGGPAG